INLGTALDDSYWSSLEAHAGRIHPDHFLRIFPLTRTTPTIPSALSASEVRPLLDRFTDHDGYFRIFAFQQEMEETVLGRQPTTATHSYPLQATSAGFPLQRPPRPQSARESRSQDGDQIEKTHVPKRPQTARESRNRRASAELPPRPQTAGARYSKKIDVMQTLLSHLMTHRVRLWDSFADFDPLKKGVVSQGGFKNGLTTMGLRLRAEEMQQLFDRYKSSDGRFRYHDFCSELDAANRQRIEKTDTKTAKARTGYVSNEPPQVTSPVVKAILDKVHSAVARHVRARGLDAAALFENYAKPGQACYGHILSLHFWRVMDDLSVKSITREDLEENGKEPLGSKALKAEFNYLAFCAVVDPTYSRAPVNAQMRNQGALKQRVFSFGGANPYYDREGSSDSRRIKRCPVPPSTCKPRRLESFRSHVFPLMLCARHGKCLPTKAAAVPSRWRRRDVEDIRRISLQEVRSRGWVIIFGKVYNLSEYVERHPGGADLLLGVAGRDATVEFETMRHSSAALVQMEKLFVGICDSAKTSESSEPAKPLQLTGGRQSSRLKINQVDSWWNVEECGFLPCADPVKELPAPWDRLVKLSEVLPSLTVHGKFRTAAERELSHALPQNRAEIKEALDVLSEGEAESLHSLLGYICLAYLHGPPDVYEKGQTVKLDILGRRPDLDHLPAWLSMPWICVSERLERRPMLDYAGCVLNNWERLDPAGPIKPSNLRLLRRFTGLVDEEWFFKTHIIIESEGGHVISSLEAISCAMKDENIHNLLQELHTLEEALWRLASVCLPIMFTRSPSDHSLMCEPFLFFFRLRPYIKSIDVTMDVDDGKEAFTLNGPSGAMSTILPASLIENAG
ncbi:Ido1, partial [Symbiodinium necroappetens]